jgi:glycosyltransferase involved in cell wall biosynthesis
MAAALPVIATEVGGNPEAVERGRTGLLVPPRAPAALAEALAQLAADPDRRAAMGRAGRERVGARFSLLAAVERHERLYDGLLADAAAPVGRLIEPGEPA